MNKVANGTGSIVTSLMDGKVLAPRRTRGVKKLLGRGKDIVRRRNGTVKRDIMSTFHASAHGV